MRIQGIGTDFYGKSEYNKIDKSYVTTKWFVFFLLPIIPLKSYRITKEFGYEKSYIIAFSSAQHYKILEEIPLKRNRKQILLTYLAVYGTIGLLILSAVYPVFIFPFAAIILFCLIKYLISGIKELITEHKYGKR